jgi:hypothetical protein
MKTKIFMFAMLAFSSMVKAESEPIPPQVQLFEYTAPEHEVQVAYILRISEYIMTKQKWIRKFDPSACPETTILVCPEGSDNDCKPTDPPGPPNVCDLPTHLQDDDCNPGGNCEDLGTCPIPICEVPLELRLEKAGVLVCEPDYCKIPENQEKPECKPVDRCDLEIYANHLEECNNPPDPEEPYCKKYPHLCVNVCDVTGNYEECDSDYCKVFPDAPYCITHPPTDPCTVDNQNVVDGKCCIGDSCETPVAKCKWGYHVGKRFMETVGEVEFTNSSTKDVDGNIVLSCLNEVTTTHKQNIVFKCFEDAVDAEFTAIEEGQIDAMIYANRQDGDVTTVTKHDDGTISAEYTNEKRDVLSF